MKKGIYTLLTATLLAGAALTSCSDNNEEKAEGGSYVNFSISGGTTRTVRDAADKYQINWLDGGADKVRVFCAEAISTNNQGYADYQVKKIDGQAANTGKLEYIADGLKWSEDYKLHHFYAVYPASDDRVAGVDSQGRLLLNAPMDQKVTVTSTETTSTGTQYVCAPVMENAYMVAKCDAYTSTTVPLTFVPIMTTLDVTVVNDEDANNSINTITLTGVSIVDENGSGNTQFKYDFSKGAVAGEATTKMTQTTFIAFTDQAGNHYIDLKAGESVKFTVFLPPVPVNEKHQVKVRVSCVGGSPNVITLGGNTQTDASGKEHKLAFAAGSLGNVKLKVKKSDTNNWITPLDSTIYVQQLSIPGSNESISYMAKEDKDKTQSKTITEQLNMGIRAFDIQVNKGVLDGSSYTLYAGDDISGNFTDAGKTSYSASLRNLLREFFVPFLEKNPKEFIIMQLKTESRTWSGLGTRIEDDLLLSGTNSSLTRNRLVMWKPELTIDEARGNVVVLMREATSSSNSGKYPARETEGLKTTTTKNDNTSLKSIDLTNDNGTTKLYHFARNSGGNYDSDPETRFGFVKNMLAQAKQNNDGYPWCLCYIAGSDDESSSKGYFNNATKMHPLFFNWINEQTSYGPLGIVLMDYVGVRKVDGYDGNLYGDLLVEGIIDNNYRFNMKHR